VQSHSASPAWPPRHGSLRAASRARLTVSTPASLGSTTRSPITVPSPCRSPSSSSSTGSQSPRTPPSHHLRPFPSTTLLPSVPFPTSTNPVAEHSHEPSTALHMPMHLPHQSASSALNTEHPHWEHGEQQRGDTLPPLIGSLTPTSSSRDIFNHPSIYSQPRILRNAL
jgi:hypothetical protein